MRNMYLAGAVLAVAGASVAVFPVGVASAQHLCPADRPCVTELYQSGSTIQIGWDGHQNFDAYNVRWSRPGRAESQFEVSGGSRGHTQITNAHSHTTYTVKVQGCTTHFLASSTCTPWAEETITTK